MTPSQLLTLATLLKLETNWVPLLSRVLIDRQEPLQVIQESGCNEVQLRHYLEQLHQADQRIRAAYVVHAPTEFRIMVGHHSQGRMPGALKLEVGQTVRLVAHSTERWIPVQITSLPVNRHDYYRGVILEQLAPHSLFQAGNGAMFSEDQIA